MESRPFGTSLGRDAVANVQATVVSSFGDPSVLETGTISIAEPSPKQCIIKVHACGVNPVDTYIRSGVYPKLPSLPFTPGKDASGVVHSIGSDVKNVAVGDRVYIFGALTGSYAQYTLCGEENIFHLPANVSFEKGACLGTPAFTAFRALFDKARGRPGDLVFVHGATGGVGLIAVQLARASGMRVVGTAGSESGMRVMDIPALLTYSHIVLPLSCRMYCLYRPCWRQEQRPSTTTGTPATWLLSGPIIHRGSTYVSKCWPPAI